ncbi:hypothetical protein E8D34_10545 [Nocardioides sp. GY 10113]|uniref:hypothetical protein n=1 Tax=Nocardioides sp. GY 10113 TaxID=2569761 RepID=UPI0010A8F368|nr:hypothetical protein [Nocardioides sp. GY 10113]TIC87543.1 hypothetical protein E8D34_10545 [Nocardioides sp. GY 10113]
MGIDARGDVTAVFEGARGRVRAVRRVVGRGWLASVPLSPGQHGWVQADVAVDARGDATAIWDSDGKQRAVSRPHLGRWSTPVRVDASGASADVWTLTMDDAGTALVVLSDAEGRISVRSKPLHGDWRRPEMVQAAGSTEFSGLAVNPRGDALLTWTEGDWATFTHLTRHAAYRPRGGTWGAPRRVARAEFASVALDRTGDATAVWGRSGGIGRIWARTMTAPAPLVAAGIP